MVPLAGIEPALLAESDFESDASTSSAIGATRSYLAIQTGGRKPFPQALFKKKPSGTSGHQHSPRRNQPHTGPLSRIEALSEPENRKNCNKNNA